MNSTIKRSVVFLVVSLIISICVGIAYKQTNHAQNNEYDQSSTSENRRQPNENRPKSPNTKKLRTDPKNRQGSLDAIEGIRAQIRTISQSNEQWSKKLDKLSDLCADLSLSIEMEAGLEIVFAEVGPGELRDWMITAMIGSGNCSVSEAVQRIRKFDNKNELSAGLAGLSSMTRISEFSPEELHGLKLSDREIKALALGLSMKIGAYDKAGNQFQVPNAMDMLVAASGDGGISDEVLSEFLDHVSRTRPFDALKIGIARLSNSERSATHYKMYEHLVQHSIRSGSAATMDELIRSGGSGSHLSISSLVGTGIAEWLKIDATAAKSWVDKNRALLDPKVTSLVTGQLAEFSAKNNDIPLAKQIAEQITDPEIKNVVNGRIWTSELNSLRKEVGRDPAGTIQALVSDQSKYDDYWLEEAMKTWIVKDFDKAQGWYQQNWQTLPANKAQYVAAAFATHAVKQGDTATARQWVGYIQNPKTKQRVEAGIAKAEHADSHQ